MDWIIKEERGEDVDCSRKIHVYDEIVIEAENEEYIEVCLEALQKGYPDISFWKEKKTQKEIT